MRWFDDISLRYKLFINFLLTGGILIIAILFCVFQIQNVGKDTLQIAKNWLPSVQAAGEISQLRLRYRVRSLEYLLPGSAEEKTKLESSLKKLDEEVIAAFQSYEKLIQSDEERGIYMRSIEAANAYRSAVSEAIELAKAGKEDEAQQLRKTTWVKAANLLRDQTDALVKYNREGSDAAAAKAEKNVNSATQIGTFALILGSIFALFLAYLIARHIELRLKGLINAANLIANGDLRGQLPVASRDEVGQLVTSVGDMQSALRISMGETRKSAEIIQGSSTRLNATVHQIDHASEIQSSAAAAIAANVEELVVSINHVAASTGDAANLAHNSDHQAQLGNEALSALQLQIEQVAVVVKEAAEQIGQLANESAKISQIVAIIRDIADQTNLLALNAAIEAARAGDMGRGFAVVADEVRKLAERTAESTREISRTVQDIQSSTAVVVQGVGRGVQLVDSSVTLAQSAGDAIANLRHMAQQVSEIVRNLSSSLSEQSEASTDVAVRIEQISAQAEQTSRAIHETTVAADTLSQTAQSMQQVVARFKI